MNRRAHPTHLAHAVGVVVALLFVVSCTSGGRLPDAVDGTVPATAPPTTVPSPGCPAAEADLDPTRSYEPLDELPAPDAMPAGSTMARIVERGRLVVGISGDTLQFGARNPQTGIIEGFDADMLREVAAAIFGVGDDEVDDYIEYKVIPYRDRLPKLEAREVDVVAHTMTINCVRWQRIAFSAEYYHAGQRLLVKQGAEHTTLDELAAARATVCVPDGSTNLEKLLEWEPRGVVIDKPTDISDCLVHLQEGTAEAITGDDTVLAGLAAQDPNIEMVGDLFTDEPYGLGFNKDDIDLVRFVNRLLEDMREDGRWQTIHERWLGTTGTQPGAATPYREVP